jgi:hypothetical protein
MVGGITFYMQAGTDGGAETAYYLSFQDLNWFYS